MNEFLESFELFKLSFLVLVPFVVSGIKTTFKFARGYDMPPMGTVLTVFLVSWAFLGANALLKYVPDSQPYVLYGAAAIIGPLTLMGAYNGVKRLVNGKPTSEEDV